MVIAKEDRIQGVRGGGLGGPYFVLIVVETECQFIKLILYILKDELKTDSLRLLRHSKG